MSDAKRREKYLKTTAGKKALGLMLRDALAGFRRTWLGKVEGGEIRLDIVQLIRICHCYSINTTRLIHRVEELSDGDGSFLTYQGCSAASALSTATDPRSSSVHIVERSTIGKCSI